MPDALIGFSGFVGSTLLRQRSFDSCYRSSTIGEIDDKRFDVVVCAGAPAQKWRANLYPAIDEQSIDSLCAHLKTISCRTFILISTVDVFKNPNGVDEMTNVDRDGLGTYGLNRHRLETFVSEHFPMHLIVRLPGLVGPGLRKNVVYDLLNANALEAVDSRAVFQFYPMINLWYDIQIAVLANLRLVHLTAEPLSVARLAQGGFGVTFSNELDREPAVYDFRSRYAKVFGGAEPYTYSIRETLAAVRAYAQTEQRSAVEKVPGLTSERSLR